MWEIPEITTMGDLADTLRLHPDDLGWLISRGGGALSPPLAGEAEERALPLDRES
jgi:hypothetical protein